MPTLIGNTLRQLEAITARAGMPRFTARQLARRLYVNRTGDLNDFTELSKNARQHLADAGYTVGRNAPRLASRSEDGTVKYLFDGTGGHDIEAVYIPDGDRATLCVSSQAGCRMGCTFCMTGRQGYHGNLTAAGIINQILSVPESDTLTNIVFMGMGEPLDNLTAVTAAIDILTAPWGMAWSPKRITVSTIGHLKGLKQLLDTTRVHIAVSLHSPVPEQRRRLMPVEAAYPIRDVITLLRQYDFTHQRRLSFEYIMWAGVNDSERYADNIARLLQGLDGCRVNLIRFHAIPDSPLRPCRREVMEQFRDRLNAHGITATIRASRGEDIMAACGMLAGRRTAAAAHDNSDRRD